MGRTRGTDTKLIATLYALADTKPTEAEFTEQHGSDDFEYHQDRHAAALDDWYKRQEDTLETVRKFPAAFSARDYYLDILEGRAAAAREADRRLTQDRKSTRLNSSHVSISYAVFCLKKKKHIQSI